MSARHPVPYGTCASNGEARTLRYELALPHRLDAVWEAVATPRGLRAWLAAADDFEPGPGGAVTFRWLNDGEAGGTPVVHGRITAWRLGRLAEYTVDIHGSVRFEVAPDDGTGTLLQFSSDFTASDALCLDCLAGWHDHFEHLGEALDGRPSRWPHWSPERRHGLREEYAARRT